MIRGLAPKSACKVSYQHPRFHHQLRSVPRPSRPAAVHAAPWGKEDVRQSVLEETAAYEEQLGEAWTDSLPEDVTELFDDVSEAAKQWNDQIDQILELPRYKQADAYFQTVSVPPVLASEMVGMGTWRLSDAIDPIIRLLASRTETVLFSNFMMELNLYPPHKWKGKFDFMDSMDPRREWDNWAWSDIPDPFPDSEDYPRMYLENRMYHTRVFRKIHVEIAARQDGLDVLHVVMYPRYSYDIPILALDVVAVKGRVTLAIIDPVPLRLNLTLPPYYQRVVQHLQDTLLPGSLADRRLPDWGKDILSPQCVCITPKSSEEIAAFVRYAVALVNAHTKLGVIAQPLGSDTAQLVARRQEILACHKRFCEKNLENKKTSRALEVAFGEELTKEYMEHVMFDFDPEDDPEWVDGGVGALYRYMEANPPKDPMWEEELEYERRDKAREQHSKAQQLGQLAEGLKQVTAALEAEGKGMSGQITQFLYENDPEFKGIMDQIVSELAEQEENAEENWREAAAAEWKRAHQKWYVP